MASGPRSDGKIQILTKDAPKMGDGYNLNVQIIPVFTTEHDVLLLISVCFVAEQIVLRQFSKLG